jgi:hypothetical protein
MTYLTFRQQAVGRVAQMFLNNENYTRPADLIADIIHYCAETSEWDFDQELTSAYDYVRDETELDVDANEV